MSKKVNEELLSLDKRILSRKVSHGEISEKDLQSFLKHFLMLRKMPRKLV